MSLKKEVFIGIIWTMADLLFLKGASFVAAVILARILGPSEFGLIGMISVFIAIGVSIVDSGLSSSIIRTKDANTMDYNTVFYLNLGISLFIYVFFYLVSPFIAVFYNQEILTDIIRLYGISFIISAFSSVQLAILNKNMEFRKVTQLNIPGTLLGVFVGLALGYLGYGVWSIVWMYLSTQIIQSILLWLYSDWKPQLQFSIDKMKYHFNFGYKLTLSGLLHTVFNNIYNVIIGKFYSVKQLGFFERARTFNEYPATILTGIIVKVTYPLMAKIQHDNDKIKDIYKQLLQFSFFVTAPLMFGSAAIARPLFELFLGKEWLPAVIYFQILCLASMFTPIHAFNINVLKVYGRTDLFLKVEIIKKSLVLICVLATIPFGIIGLVWSCVIVSVLGLIINMHYSRDMIHYKTMAQLKDMVPTFFSAAITFLVMYLIMFLFQNNSLYFQIILPTLTGIIFYLGVNYFFKSTPMLFTLKLINVI